MLIPQLNYCQQNNCKSLVITDSTGLYSVNNIGGFGTPNIDFSDVSSAHIKITDTNNTLFDICVTNFFKYAYIGRVSCYQGNIVLTGYNTSFLATVSPGDSLFIGADPATAEVCTVITVDSDTSITINGALGADALYTMCFNFNTVIGSNDTTVLTYELLMSDFGSSVDNGFIDGVYYVEYEISTISDTYTYDRYCTLFCNTECCVQHMIQQIPDYYKCNNCDNTFVNKAILASSLLDSLKYASLCGNISQYNNIAGLLSKFCNTTNCNNCN